MNGFPLWGAVTMSKRSRYEQTSELFFAVLYFISLFASLVYFSFVLFFLLFGS